MCNSEFLAISSRLCYLRQTSLIARNMYFVQFCIIKRENPVPAALSGVCPALGVGSASDRCQAACYVWKEKFCPFVCYCIPCFQAVTTKIDSVYPISVLAKRKTRIVQSVPLLPSSILSGQDDEFRRAAFMICGISQNENVRHFLYLLSVFPENFRCRFRSVSGFARGSDRR